MSNHHKSFSRARVVVFAAGAVLGLLLWHVSGHVGGDGFFHLARIQKLLAFGDLSLGSANEFPDGGLHPGYAFPLWHGFLALVAKVSGADPADVVLHGPTVLAPLAVLIAYEAGWALFRRVVPATASAAAGVAIVAMAPGSGGALTALALPATASRQLLVPAALALGLEATRRPTPALLASAAAASLALAVVHPTYALFLWLPFAGFLLVRWLWERRDARAGGLALAALVLPAGLFFAWLLPVIGDTASVDPGAAERERGFEQYAGQLHGTADRFSVVPELFGRTGAVAVAALLVLPLAGLASRRRWAAYVVGGSLAVFVVCLVPWLFTPFSDAVSLSQSRRLAGFLPLAFALAGGVGVLARLIGRAAVPVALAGGIVLQLLFPGDFGYTLEDGGPAWATWFAVGGAVVALALGFRRRPPLERTAALASALVLLPTYVHGLVNWSPSEARRPNPLSEGLIDAVREDVPVGAVVYADPETSYRLGAFAPVRVCVNPPGHVADTVDNRPRERVQEFRRFARTGDLSIPRACGATWLVVDRDRFPRLAPDLPIVHRDARWALYRNPTAYPGVVPRYTSQRPAGAGHVHRSPDERVHGHGLQEPFGPADARVRDRPVLDASPDLAQLGAADVRGRGVVEARWIGRPAHEVGEAGVLAHDEYARPPGETRPPQPSHALHLRCYANALEVRQGGHGQVVCGADGGKDERSRDGNRHRERKAVGAAAKAPGQLRPRPGYNDDEARRRGAQVDGVHARIRTRERRRAVDARDDEPAPFAAAERQRDHERNGGDGGQERGKRCPGPRERALERAARAGGRCTPAAESRRTRWMRSRGTSPCGRSPCRGALPARPGRRQGEEARAPWWLPRRQVRRPRGGVRLPRALRRARRARRARRHFAWTRTPARRVFPRPRRAPSSWEPGRRAPRASRGRTFPRGRRTGRCSAAGRPGASRSRRRPRRPSCSRGAGAAQATRRHDAVALATRTASTTNACTVVRAASPAVRYTARGSGE